VDVAILFGGSDPQIHVTGGLLHPSHTIRLVDARSFFRRSVLATLDAIFL
jgi:hypothetical protein